jgi:hypothetical protein
VPRAPATAGLAAGQKQSLCAVRQRDFLKRCGRHHPREATGGADHEILRPAGARQPADRTFDLPSHRGLPAQPLIQDIIDVGETEQLCRGAIGPQHVTEIAAQHCHGIALGKVIADGSMDRKIDERIVMCRHGWNSSLGLCVPFLGGIKGLLIALPPPTVQQTGA